MQISAAAVWLNTVFAGFDISVTTAIHNLYYLAGDFFTPFFEFVSFLAKDGILLILLSFALILFKKTRRYGTAMIIALAVGALLTNCCLKVFIARQRPYIDENSIYYQFWLLVGQCTESDKSFPSGHTNAAFAAMIPIVYFGDKRVSWTALIFSFLMAVGRIYLVLHFPSDVLGGILSGTIAGITGIIVTVKLPESYYAQNDFFRKNAPGEHAA